MFNKKSVGGQTRTWSAGHDSFCCRQPLFLALGHHERNQHKNISSQRKELQETAAGETEALTLVRNKRKPNKSRYKMITTSK
eukprot:scaffold8266_cov97-Cylindrotheca_fusiformis.AAC.1